MKRYLLAAAMFGALASPSNAIELRTLGGIDWNIEQGTTLDFSAAQPPGNQPQNNPCIICGANQPNQTNTALGFGYTDFNNKGNLETAPFFSSGILRDTVLAADTISAVNYSGAQLQAVVLAINALAGFNGSTQFSIGIDVNDTNKVQTLESFFFLDVTPGSFSVLASFLPGLDDGINLLAPNNGTGFPDFQLTGLDTANLDPTHQYAFFARMTNLNDGPDSFFLTAAVPGPVAGAGIPSLIAACGALIALARRRRQQTV